MKFENENKLSGATGAIKAIYELLEIEDNSSELKMHDTKIKYLKEVVVDIEQVMKDENVSTSKEN